MILHWDALEDLDLEVIDPNSQEISYTNSFPDR